jgi:hypothetical protein
MPSLSEYHAAFDDGVRWRLTADGIEVEGAGVERTGGEPKTVQRIWADFGASIVTWATHYQVPCVLIIATIATETRGNPAAVREEPGYQSDDATPGKVSPGLMQTLIATARATLHDPTIDRQWLLSPGNSIQAGTSYINDQRGATELDPPKVACAYNAGGVYHNAGAANRWKMRQFPIGTAEHCNRFVQWFNDAVFALAAEDMPPEVSYRTFYGLA